MAKKPALGKGLSALINEDSAGQISTGFLPKLPIDLVEANPYQPRIHMDPEKLVELSDSIREHGVIEPLLVTKKEDNKYELIAGERRWRAAQLAGMKTVPAIVKEATPKQMLEIAVIENLQRQDLNALEEANAFEQLQKSFKLTHEQIAKKIGISRAAIANKIRLLALPDEIKKGLLEEKISEGHARAILGLKNKDSMIATYKMILRDHLSVRAVEELVRRLNQGKVKPKARDRIVDDTTISIEKDLKDRYGKAVSLMRSKRGGRITMKFKNDDEMHGLLKLLLE